MPEFNLPNIPVPTVDELDAFHLNNDSCPRCFAETVLEPEGYVCKRCGVRYGR